jgi:hypothetical protein
MEQRPVSREAIEAARKIASKNPWHNRWRVNPDGTLEVAYISKRRNVLARFGPDGAAEEVDRSAQQSWFTAVLQNLWVVAVVGLVELFDDWRVGLVILTLGVGVAAFGFRLGTKPDLYDWLRGSYGEIDDWTPMPRLFGELPPTGNQVVAICRAAAEHRDTALCRVLPGGVVELAVEGPGGYEIFSVDQRGRLREERAVAVKAPTSSRLRKVDGGPKWQYVETGDPPGD